MLKKFQSPILCISSTRVISLKGNSSWTNVLAAKERGGCTLLFVQNDNKSVFLVLLLRFKPDQWKKNSCWFNQWSDFWIMLRDTKPDFPILIENFRFVSFYLLWVFFVGFLKDSFLDVLTQLRVQQFPNNFLNGYYGKVLFSWSHLKRAACS